MEGTIGRFYNMCSQNNFNHLKTNEKDKSEISKITIELFLQ